MDSTVVQNIRRWCGCGTLVWDCPPGSEPGYQEAVICQSCGKGHPNHPWPWYQLWWLAFHYRVGRKRLRGLCRFRYGWQRSLAVKWLRRLGVAAPRGWTE